MFINGICDEFEKGTGSERLDHLATEAYNVTLKKYHKWIVQNIFKVGLKDSVIFRGLFNSSILCWNFDDFPSSCSLLFNSIMKK